MCAADTRGTDHGREPVPQVPTVSGARAERRGLGLTRRQKGSDVSLNFITRKRSGDSVGTREVRVRVRGGYEPDTIRAEAGVPLRIVFRREETAACSERVIFPAFGKSATLPAGRDIAVELLPEEAGSTSSRAGWGCCAAG